MSDPIPTYDGTPILSEDCEPDGLPLFEMWAGAYGDVKAFVFARSFERALEHFAEYLDDHAPGCLTSFSEDDYREAAEELGLTWPVPDEQLGRVVERAEVDHISLGHTTLKNGTHIASWEWGGHDVTSEAIIASCKRILGNRFHAITEDNPEHPGRGSRSATGHPRGRAPIRRLDRRSATASARPRDRGGVVSRATDAWGDALLHLAAERWSPHNPASTRARFHWWGHGSTHWSPHDPALDIEVTDDSPIGSIGWTPVQTVWST